MFCDHATGYTYVSTQVSLRAGETIVHKQKFEQIANTFGVKILNYRGDNGIFKSAEFKQHIKLKDQNIDFSGVGAHHQNGVAERAIQKIM